MVIRELHSSDALFSGELKIPTIKESLSRETVPYKVAMTIIWRLVVIICHCQFSNEKPMTSYENKNMTLHQMIDSCSSIWATMDAEIEYPLEYSYHPPFDPRAKWSHWCAWTWSDIVSGVTWSTARWRFIPCSLTLVDQTGQSRVESSRSEEANNSCQYGFIFRTSLAILYYRMIRAQSRQDRQGRHT